MSAVAASDQVVAPHGLGLIKSCSCCIEAMPVEPDVGAASILVDTWYRKAEQALCMSETDLMTTLRQLSACILATRCIVAYNMILQQSYPGRMQHVACSCYPQRHLLN
jgi:hypothetical protein